ncbi:MAG: ABC-type transport auxiliary lipoprotein family protein [Pseudomonadota bacterium]
MKQSARVAAMAFAASALGACSLNLTPEPPASLLTLSPNGADTTGTTTRLEDGPIAVRIPEVPAKLNVSRIPVTVSETEIAYLQEAYWVERPSRLFRRLLGEALRARGPMLVLDSDDTPALAKQTLRGTLLEMGYDAQSSSVVVVYDAVRTDADGRQVITRRFEARESGVLPEPAAVGPALNRAANRVVAEVAQWIVENPPPPPPPPKEETKAEKAG